jgi:hypothetical protein
VGGFSTPLPPTNRLFRQKINKETTDLNDIIDQMDLIDIYKVFHPATAGYFLLSSP